MRYVCLIALLAATFLIGCSDQPSSTSAAGASGSSDEASATAAEAAMATTEEAASIDEAMVEDVADQLAKAADETDVPQAQDFGEWLAPPDGLSDRLAQAYPQMVEAAMAGGADRKAYLAQVSQLIGNEFIEKGDKQTGYQFYEQAGKALRASMEGGFKDAPPSFVGEVFYNEACALAVHGKLAAATDALAEAIQNGFSNMELLASDEDLAPLRSTEGFDAKLADWKRVAEEKIKAHAREELAAGETFPFSFALMDIEGTEQSLEALKGKVVIVDVWGTWCPPCRAEVPSFIKLQDKYGEQGFQMIGLNYERTGSDEEDLAAVVDYVAENGVNYPCIMGDDATREMIPDFQGFPTTLFIDKTGTVRMKAVGLHDYGYLDAIVSELLAE
jgi:thiol-disulfide isomerase/thioredoxin